ncbi:MAG: hypothetical protein AB8C13_04840 [Phycisphaerales bacterium]
MSTVRMYTCFTESHKPMLDEYFLPSVPDSFEVVVNQFDQECETGEYLSDGWVRAVSRKIEVIREAIEHTRSTEGPDYFVFSDCDIRFFTDLGPDIAHHMKTHDFIAMDDDIYCTGFMGIRADDRAAFMWKWAAENIEKYGCDQPTGNAFIKAHLRAMKLGKLIPRVLQTPKLRRHTDAGPMRFGKFPRIKYFNHMHLGIGDAIWDGVVPIKITDAQFDSMLMLHANYTRGMENKVRLLEEIGQRKIDHDRAKKAKSELAAKAASPEPVA